MALPSTRMLVLAVVRILQPVHGYDVRRELLSWHADQWANIAPGSIYSALKTLHRDGLIDVDGVAQHGTRPERTAYRLTDEGEKEFGGLLRDALWSSEVPRHPYMPAISLWALADRDDVIAALRSRIARFEADLTYANREIERISAGSHDPAHGGVPAHVADMMRLQARHLDAEIEWAQTSLRRILDGELDVWSPPASQT